MDIKGFDIYINAIAQLPIELKNKVQFYLAGKGECESELATYRDTCWAYLGGVIDTHEAIQAWKKFPALFCLPKDVSRRQLLNTFIKHANNNPEGLHHLASSVTVNAFVRAYPCK